MTETDKFIEKLHEIAAVEKCEKHYDEQGNYVGTTVTYKNPLHPDLKTVYHPYVPLQFYQAGEVVSVSSFKTRYGYKP